MYVVFKGQSVKVILIRYPISPYCIESEYLQFTNTVTCKVTVVIDKLQKILKGIISFSDGKKFSIKNFIPCKLYIPFLIVGQNNNINT